MPIYSYRCANCGHAQDVLQKMSDPLLVTCPSCGATALEKQVTAAGFQLKGSGWYATDFRNPATKEPEKTGAKAEGDASASKAEGGGAAPAPATADQSTADKPAPAPVAEAKGDTKSSRSSSAPGKTAG